MCDLSPPRDSIRPSFGLFEGHVVLPSRRIDSPEVLLRVSSLSSCQRNLMSFVYARLIALQFGHYPNLIYLRSSTFQ
jgi:hypothetical protein